jgi:tRNA synthetases class I (E and Q), anti-codon binding domain
LLEHSELTHNTSSLTLWDVYIQIIQQDAASIDEGEEVTLLRWTSVLVTSARRSPGDGSVLSLESEYLPVFKFLKKKKAVTWLANCADLVPLKLLQVTNSNKNNTYYCNLLHIYTLLCFVPSYDTASYINHTTSYLLQLSDTLEC